MGLLLRLALLYLTFLVLTSIYQATFPTSPHNKGEIVDHGAELLQASFEDLQTHYPRFDDFVKSTHHVILSLLLFVTMRWGVYAAFYTSVGVAFVVVAFVVVVGCLLVRVVRKVYRLVLRVVYLPIRFFRYLDELRRDILRWAWEEALWATRPKTASYRKGYTYTTESSDGSTRVWTWTVEPGADGFPPGETNTGSATGERNRAPKPEHTRPPVGGHHAPKRERPTPTGFAEFDEDHARFRRRMKQVEKDLQDQRDNADRERRNADEKRRNADRERREREYFPRWEYIMTMEAMEHMTEAGERITELSEDDETAEPARDDEQIESETNGEGESAESPHGNTDSDGHRRVNRTKPIIGKIPKVEDLWTDRRIKRGARTHEKKHPTRPMGTHPGLQRTVPDPAQPGKTGRKIKPERKSKQSKSLQHPRRTSVFQVALGPPHNYEFPDLLTRSSPRLPRESLNRTGYHNSHRGERLPPDTWAVTHTGADNECCKIRVGHHHIELSQNGGTYKLLRNGEMYEFPSNDKPCRLWINGDDVKIKWNGETIELPRNGKQMSPGMNGQDQDEASKASEAPKTSEPLPFPNWRIRRPSQSNKQTPPNTFGYVSSAHSTVTSEDRGERVTYSIGDAIAEVVRHREQMGLPRSDGKPIKLSFDGKHTDHVVFERDGEWIKLPKSGEQTKPKGTGGETKSETNDEGIKPRTTDQETKPRTDDGEIMPETTDEQIKRTDQP